MQRLCPRGEVSASADEGGIPVVSFLSNGWHNIFTPLTTSWSPPPVGENFILEPAPSSPPPGESPQGEVVFVTHPARWAPLSRGELFNSPPMQRFCPRGEVSAPADEGGIPVVSFLSNGWHNIFTPLTTSWSPPPVGENFILEPAPSSPPLGECGASRRGGILPPMQEKNIIEKTAKKFFLKKSREKFHKNNFPHNNNIFFMI